MSRRRRMDKSSGTDFKNIELVCFLACIHILETLKDEKVRYSDVSNKQAGSNKRAGY